MHLGINAIRLTRDFTGVGRYLECVLNEWCQMDVPFDQITLYSHTALEQDKLRFPLDRFSQRVVGRRLPDPIWEYRYLRGCADEVDVMFCPSYTIPFRSKGRNVVTYLGPSENRPGSYHWWRSQAYELLYRYSAHRASKVFACSHAVKDRLTDVFKIPADKVQVTYLAASDAFRPIDDSAILKQVRQDHGLGDKPFILFVGKLARRHYIPNLLRAFADLKTETRIPHRMVLVGPDYLKLNIPLRAQRLGVGDSVTHIPFLPHKDLPPLYNAAEFFVFPGSHAEGFGIPVVEAMACGTPVVTVNQGSLMEIAPGASVAVKSSAVAHLREGMQLMANDARLREELAAKGLQRAKNFTWRFTAERTMETLWNVAQS